MKLTQTPKRITSLCFSLSALLAAACGGPDDALSWNDDQALAAQAQPGGDEPLPFNFCDQIFDVSEPQTLDDATDYQCNLCRFGNQCGFSADDIAKACNLCPEIYDNEPEQENGNNDAGFAPRALISGVPRYLQTDVDDYLPGDQCGGKPFLSGCGPVAGATILGWWDRRGYDALVDDSDVTADGLPEQAIFDLGRAQYMDRISFCNAGTAVDPFMFLDGLRDFMDDNYVGTDFVVTKYKITTNSSSQLCYKKKEAGQPEQSCDTDMEHLAHIVKQQINMARPMVLLLRSDGLMNPNGTFKYANHYVTVVGYDDRGSDLELIVQYNHGDGYQNHYSDTTTPIVLGDHTVRSAAVKYNLYTIEPGAPIGQGYVDECQGLLMNGTSYHNSPHDGVATSYFHPHCDEWDGSTWGVTTRIYHQDDICLVARWR